MGDDGFDIAVGVLDDPRCSGADGLLVRFAFEVAAVRDDEFLGINEIGPDSAGVHRIADDRGGEDFAPGNDSRPAARGQVAHYADGVHEGFQFLAQAFRAGVSLIEEFRAGEQFFGQAEMPFPERNDMIERRFRIAGGGIIADFIQQVRHLRQGGYDDNGLTLDAGPYDFNDSGDGGRILYGRPAEFHNNHTVKSIRLQR